MERTVLSKRLCSIVPPKNTEVKLNGVVYLAGISLHLHRLGESEKDYTFDFNASNEFNYFCYNKQNKITCWLTIKGEQPVTERGQWVKEGRQELKPGRFLLMFSEWINCRTESGDKIDEPMLRQKIIARLCEIFADSIRGCNEEIAFSISNDVESIYDTPEIEGTEHLSTSCMIHNADYTCHEFARFYNHIPNVKVVYQKIVDKLLFRALLWENIQMDNGATITFLDRIYGANSVNNKLIDYAKERGWAWRIFDSTRVHLGENDDVQIQCTIPEAAMNYLREEGSPYVDTLYKLTEYGDKYILSNYLNAAYCLQECDGRAVRERFVCVDCGNSISDGNERTNENGETYCENCYNETYQCCDCCREDHDRDDVYWIDGRGEYMCNRCLQHNGYEECHHCGEWHDDLIEADGYSWCVACYEEVFIECELCQEPMRMSNRDGVHIILDGEDKVVCRDCLEDGTLLVCIDCGGYFTEDSGTQLINGMCPTCHSISKSRHHTTVQRVRVAPKL